MMAVEKTSISTLRLKPTSFIKGPFSFLFLISTLPKKSQDSFFTPPRKGQMGVFFGIWSMARATKRWCTKTLDEVHSSRTKSQHGTKDNVRLRENDMNLGCVASGNIDRGFSYVRNGHTSPEPGPTSLYTFGLDVVP